MTKKHLCEAPLFADSFTCQYCGKTEATTTWDVEEVPMDYYFECDCDEASHERELLIHINAKKQIFSIMASGVLEVPK